MADVRPIPERHQVEQLLTRIGPRLHVLRRESGLTLRQVAELTGISASTLSRLESGRRRPSLDLLVVLAAAYGRPLDELVAVAERATEPPVAYSPPRRRGVAAQRLSRHQGGIQAYRLVLPPGEPPDRRRHEGYTWLYVLDGRIDLLLADERRILEEGEAVEFPNSTPHWFGAADNRPAAVLLLVGAQGQRVRQQMSARGDSIS